MATAVVTASPLRSHFLAKERNHRVSSCVVCQLDHLYASVLHRIRHEASRPSGAKKSRSQPRSVR